jgi:hypothetical protein
MEDIALSRALRQRGAPLCLRQPVTTSGRRWDHHGFVRTVTLMWRLRYAYWRGTDPHVNWRGAMAADAIERLIVFARTIRDGARIGALALTLRPR